jgi:DNA-binding transcriptional ArsR family regulator
MRTLLANKKVKKRYAVLRAISGPTRYKILVLLGAYPSGLTVSEIAAALGASLSRVSHQMRILRKQSVVSGSRNSRTITYVIADRKIARSLAAFS